VLFKIKYLVVKSCKSNNEGKTVDLLEACTNLASLANETNVEKCEARYRLYGTTDQPIIVFNYKTNDDDRLFIFMCCEFGFDLSVFQQIPYFLDTNSCKNTDCDQINSNLFETHIYGLSEKTLTSRCHHSAAQLLHAEQCGKYR